MFINILYPLLSRHSTCGFDPKRIPRKGSFMGQRSFLTCFSPLRRRNWTIKSFLSAPRQTSRLHFDLDLDLRCYTKIILGIFRPYKVTECPETTKAKVRGQVHDFYASPGSVWPSSCFMLWPRRTSQTWVSKKTIIWRWRDNLNSHESTFICKSMRSINLNWTLTAS